MKKSDFYYDLPPELIAQYPVKNRTESKLLVLNISTGEILHRKFSDIVDFISLNDLLVLNNTKVIPARLFGQKETGGRVEILIEKISDEYQALVHCRASKRPKFNQKIFFADQVYAEIKDSNQDLLILQFNQPIKEILNQYGHIPLPNYLHRKDEESDKERYQTVYAKYEGSVAAPTAGLHFDEQLLAKLNAVYVTLHVGAGTFQSIRVENLDDHQMHFETAEISENVCSQIRHTKFSGGKIIAVGTTSVRTLETASLSSDVKPFLGETNLFIRPGFQFHTVDALITNFHLPESTLLMLVCAFGGYEKVMNAYKIAIENHYRFFSYGDAMFLI